MAQMLELLINDFKITRISRLKNIMPKESNMCEQVQKFTKARKTINYKHLQEMEDNKEMYNTMNKEFIQ